MAPSWSDNAGKYTGNIEYEGETGRVSMILDNGVSEALLVCIGETITAFATRAAQQVANNLISSAAQAKAIADKPIEQVQEVES